MEEQVRIPVLGFPILNKPDLMRRMLDSVDHDIDRLYIVDNGGVVTGDMVRHYRANDIHICDPGYNVGVGPSWNLIIKANIQAPWWLISSNDVRFSPGALTRLVEDMGAHSGIPHLSRIVIGNESWGNHFGAFALNPEAIDMVGWFDENIYPIYFEDTEFLDRVERAKKSGFTISDIPSRTHHDGNQSWQGNPQLASGNKRTWDINRDYRDDKWNIGGVEYEYPFDIGEEAGLVRGMEGLRYSPQTTVERLREQDWHVARKDNVKNEGIFA